MLRVGVIGLGYIADAHLRALRSLEAEGVARCVAVADLVPDVRERFQREYEIPRVYAHHRELLADADIDAVAVILGHHLHAPLSIDALEAGKHVLVEKPMATTAAECDAMVDAEARSGRVLQAGYTWQFHPGPRQARELLDSNALGRMLTAVATVSAPWRLETRREQYRNRAMGGGYLLANGVHFAALLTWMLGSHAVAVKAKVGTTMHYQAGDDSATVFVEYANGATGVLVSMGTVRGAAKLMLEGHCTQGDIRVERDHAAVGQDGAWRRLEGDGSDGFTEQYRHFAASIAAGVAPHPNGRFGRHIMDILFAAEKSSITGREVPLAYR